MKCLSLFSGLLLAASQLPQLVIAESTTPPEAPDLEVSDYVRFQEGAERDSLQTAVTRFTKEGMTVDLVAVVHLGDSDYFENLNRLLATYDRVLYEMVGGAYSPESESAGSGVAESDEMTGIRQLQTMAKSFLGLEFQLDGIDYTAENFVHADVEWDGLDSLMSARNQSFSEIFTRAMALSSEGNLAGIPGGEAGMNAMFTGLLRAVTTGDSNGLKRILAPLLSEAEVFITQLEGDDGTVLVTERNKLVMQRLAEEQGQHGPGNYAIFYGAGHMPDLEERLLALGYVQEETAWADAWLMEPSGAEDSASDPVTEPGDFLLNLLEQNPEIINSLQKMGEMLEGLQTPE